MRLRNKGASASRRLPAYGLYESLGAVVTRVRSDNTMGDRSPSLRIRRVQTTPVLVPMNYALGTSRARVTAAPLLLVDLETEQGVTGRSYLFCYLPAAAPAIARIVEHIEGVVKGQPVSPAELWRKLATQFTLIGVQGIVRMALAALDVAAWDALAIAAGMPLARFLGSEIKPVRAYNSCGLGLMDQPAAVADEAEKLLAGGLRAIKLRLGYPSAEQDIATFRAVRKRIGDAISVMVDYNQALSVAEALHRGRMLDAENIFWLEEPIRHDDYAGLAKLASELKTPIQIGENFSETTAMAAAIAAKACDFVMPDLERIGGVSGWQRAAGLAFANGVEMSSHLFPEVSAHLLAATPTCHFLEYVDWADKILQEPLRIADGAAIPGDRPGNGLVWDAGAVRRYRLN
jgi:mandelate racemase